VGPPPNLQLPPNLFGDPLGVGDRGGPESPLLLHFATLQRLRRFARYWDLVGNSGNFIEATPLLWRNSGDPFGGFLRWSDWLFVQIGRTDSIALPRLAEFLFQYLTRELSQAHEPTALALARDWQRAGRREAPECLRPFLPPEARPPTGARPDRGMKRQLRHLGQPAAPGQGRRNSFMP
jgi:hypothetical protein